MRAELANLNHCTVPFLSHAAVNLSWYDSIVYLPKTKKFGCVGRETRLLFSVQNLRNGQKSGETCQLTWEIRRVLRVDRWTAKTMP